MKKKRELGRKLLNFLLTLAMVVGLLPGMGLTAYAADEHDHTGWTEWTDATSLPSTEGNYYLKADVTIDSTWIVPTGENKLCLNGHSITYTGDRGSVIEVLVGAMLNLYDCDTETPHKYSITDGLAVLSDSGDKLFTGGYITGGKYNMYKGNGVYIGGGVFNMYGGTIVGNAADRGGGVLVYKDSEDGIVSGNFTMSGGSIIGNKADIGGGVCINDDCTFTMSGGSISNNSADYYGGGVGDYGTFTMSGGSISNNSGANYGGGVAINDGKSFAMSGGSITGNSANLGGGVYVSGGYAVEAYQKDPATFKVSGDVTITDNKQILDEGVTDCNVFLNRASSDVYSVITIAGALGGSTRIGVTLENGYSGAFTSSPGSVKAKDYAASFTGDDAAYSVLAEGDELKLGTVTKYPIWVGGVQVTSANKDDVLGDADAGETVKYTPAQGTTPATLSLNEATISGGSSESKNAAIYAIGELTINVTGNNMVTGPVNQTGGSYGIRVDDNQKDVNVSLNITGSGTLDTKGGVDSYESCGIQTWKVTPGEGDITIGADTTVIAVGQGSSSGFGIYSRGKVNVNGSLTATGVANGVCAESEVNVNDNAKLTATGDRAIYGTVMNAIAGTGWTDTAGTTGKAAIAVRTQGTTLGYKKVQFPVVKDPAEVTTKPTAKTLTYTGSAQELVTAGKAKGGEMQYAIGKDAIIAPTEGWKTSIPKGTEAGTYYVWYKVDPATNYNGVAPACIVVKIKKNETSTTTPTETTEKVESVTVYRLYYGPTMEHFYTTSAYERRVLIDKYGWVDEGIAWKSPNAPTTDAEKKTIKPVYRLFNPLTTDHHYTKDPNERKTLIDKYGWKDEGVAFYSNDKGDATVYRLWHPGLITGAHHFTTGKHEYDVLITRGWIGETEAFKVNAAS